MKKYVHVSTYHTISLRTSTLMGTRHTITSRMQGIVGQDWVKVILQKSAVGWPPAVLLTAQHVELFLTLFTLPAGWKTTQHIKLYLILFAWLIMPLFLQRSCPYLSCSLLRLHGCAFLPYSFILLSSTFDLSHMWILHMHAHCEGPNYSWMTGVLACGTLF